MFLATYQGKAAHLGCVQIRIFHKQELPSPPFAGFSREKSLLSQCRKHYSGKNGNLFHSNTKIFPHVHCISIVLFMIIPQLWWRNGDGMGNTQD